MQNQVETILDCKVLINRSESIVCYFLVYKDETNLSFDDLLKKEKSVNIHQRNLQVLETMMKNDLGP